MATDPPKCDEELYRDGVVAGIFGTFGANHFESLIVDLRSRLEVSIDWHYVRGRAVLSGPRGSAVVENLFSQ